MAARTFSMTLRLTFPTSFPVDPLMFLSAFVMTTTYLAPFRSPAYLSHVVSCGSLDVFIRLCHDHHVLGPLPQSGGRLLHDRFVPGDRSVPAVHEVEDDPQVGPLLHIFGKEFTPFQPLRL